MVQVVTLGRMVVIDTIYGTLWISPIIHHFFSKIKIQGSSSGRSHRESTIGSQILKDNLTMAQNRMKQQANQHRSERSFEVRDWVFLRLQPYKQMSLK